MSPELYDYEQDPHADNMSLEQAREVIGLSKRVFNNYAREYTGDGERSLSPMSVLSIAQAAYQAGASKRFFISLEAVGEEVLAHVAQHAPELETGVQAQINDFLARPDEPPTEQPAIDDSLTPPHLPSALEQAYLRISTGL